MNRARAAHLVLGRRGEEAAVRLLTDKGMTVLARNWRISSGELDIVARDGRKLVCVEVKTLHRRHDTYTPGANLSTRQRLRNYRTGRAYHKRFAAPGTPLRFDLVEVIAPRRFGAPHEIRHHLDYLPEFRPEAPS